MTDKEEYRAENITVPEEIKGWNWGAFILSWIWGIGNNTYRALWFFVPYINIVMIIYLGLKGNELAWKHKHWKSVEHFKAVQRKWNIAAFSFLTACIVIGTLGASLFVKSIDESPSYKIVMSKILTSEEIKARIGDNIQVLNTSRTTRFKGEIDNVDYTIQLEGSDGVAIVRAVVFENYLTLKIINFEVEYTNRGT